MGDLEKVLDYYYKKVGKTIDVMEFITSLLAQYGTWKILDSAVKLLLPTMGLKFGGKLAVKVAITVVASFIAVKSVECVFDGMRDVMNEQSEEMKTAARNADTTIKEIDKAILTTGEVV